MAEIRKSLSKKANELIVKAIYTENLDIIRLKRELRQLEEEYLRIILSRYNIH
jgi:hypothetical protein